MKVLGLLPVVAAVTTQDRIASMQSTLRNIASTAQKEGKIDQNTKNLVQGFMDTMNKTLVEALIKETVANQAILDADAKAILQCKTTRESTFANSIATKAGTRDGSRANLGESKNCGDGCPNGKANGGRGAAGPGTAPVDLLQAKLPNYNYSYDLGRDWEWVQGENQGLYAAWDEQVDSSILDVTKCDTTYKGECGVIGPTKTKCKELDNMVVRFEGETIAEPDFCKIYAQNAKPPSGEMHPHTDNIAARQYYTWEAQPEETDPVFKWFDHMDKFTTANVKDYKECREECHDLRSAHQHRVYESHRLQRVFEQDFCAWAHAVDVACDVYGSCYNRTVDALEKSEEIIRGEEEQFKKQQQALECALCYGAELLKDSTDLSACDRATGCVNCDPLIIDYPVPHVEINCDEKALHRPCDAEWRTAEYGCWASDCPPNDCTPCSQ